MVSLDSFVGLLAPHQCLACGQEGGLLCASCLEVAGSPMTPRCVGCHVLSDGFKTCSSCRKWLAVKSVIVATPYEGVYEDLVRAFKFGCKRQAAAPMAALINEAYSAQANSLLCPIPTASQRIRERGFDHAQLLMREFHKYNTSSLSVYAGLRRRSNARQLGASRQQRLKQMEGEFYVANTEDVRGKDVLLIDDVVTTGASLAAASKILKQAGARNISAIIFAQKT